MTPTSMTPISPAQEISAASRLDNVRYAIRDLASVAEEVNRQGHKVLALNVGDPLVFDFQTPAHIVEAVSKAMRDGKNGYAPSEGVREALDAIRGEAARKGITTVRDVFVTTGVSETVDLCLSALVNAGEDVLTPKPDYPLYSAVLCKLGIGLNAYDLNEEDAWQPELADIERKITPRTRGIVLINPNNPTGALCTREMLERIAELARRHNLIVFADEIYDKLILDCDSQGNDTPHIAFASVAPDVPCVTFGGMSKNYLVPGWRHWMGHCFRRCGCREVLYRGRPSVVARSIVREPSRAVRDQTGARRSAGSSRRSKAQAAFAARFDAEVVRGDSSSELCRTAWGVLCLPANRHSRER